MVKEMHYEEKTLFDLDPKVGQGGQGHTKCCPVPSTTCDLCTGKVWCCYILWLRRRCIYKKKHYLTWTFGSRSNKILPSTLDIVWPMHQQSLILLHPMVKEKMHLQVNILFDLDLQTKCCPVPSTSCDLCTYRVWSYCVKRFRMRNIYKKIQYSICCPVPSTSYDLSSTKFEVATSNRLGGDTFTKKKHYLIVDPDLRIKVTRNVAQYPLQQYYLFSYKVWGCYV